MKSRTPVIIRNNMINDCPIKTNFIDDSTSGAIILIIMIAGIRIIVGYAKNL